VNAKIKTAKISMNELLMVSGVLRPRLIEFQAFLYFCTELTGF